MQTIPLLTSLNEHRSQCAHPNTNALQCAEQTGHHRLVLAPHALRHCAAPPRSRKHRQGDEKGSALFAELCAAAYPMFLDDYIHFMRRHSDDAEAIKSDAHEKFGLTNCSISKCKVRRRDSRKRGGEGEGAKNKGDGEEKHFYGDVMASAHFVLQHLHEHGLRTISTVPNTERKNDYVQDEDEDDNEMECGADRGE